VQSYPQLARAFAATTEALARITRHRPQVRTGPAAMPVPPWNWEP